jgi:phosphate/sulfate permease
MGVSWMPIVFVGFIIAMLLTAASPKDRFNRFSKKNQSAVIEGKKADADVFFWVLILCLAMLAMSHFFWFPQFGWY